MMLASKLGELRQLMLSSLHSRPAFLGDLGPVVSFCFDDFPASAYTVGGAILKSFGARGTYYAAMGLMNTSNHLGDHFSRQDLDSLLADGHELACHTFSHISCRRATFRVFEDDLRRGMDAIRAATGCVPVNFSYPYGHVTLTAKKRVGPQVRSSRGIYAGLNAPTTDLNLLRANGLYGDVDRFPEMESLLSSNVRKRGWLIFYTHDVRTTPSEFGCTPALLEKVVSAAVDRGFRIAPVRDVVTCALAVSA
jgi:peptidoglycan/xylan/chitin deacetylase (PgdA/CDA1 family)